MPVNTEFLQASSVDVERARAQASTRLLLETVTQSPGTGPLMRARLGPPETIFDLSGEPLFYDFPVISPRRTKVGLVRASANRVLGVGAPALYVGAPAWNLRDAARRARRLAGREHREIIESLPVCYAYPKLGIEVRWHDGVRQQGRTIYDAGDLTVVPERSEPDLRGPGTWSVYDNLTDEVARRAVDEYARYDDLTDEVLGRLGIVLPRGTLELVHWDLLQNLVVAVLSFWRTAHLGLTLHGQETAYWCTVATGQMLLEFHGYSYTQSQIATAMGTGTSGTSWAGEEAGLESLTKKQYDAGSDFQPTFAKAKAEIDAQRPFDYSYSKHSMACAGYRQQQIFVLGTKADDALEIYDPWPPTTASGKGGTIRWENWGAASVAGYVYLRHV